MRKIRDVLRLRADGLSKRKIAASLSKRSTKAAPVNASIGCGHCRSWGQTIQKTDRMISFRGGAQGAKTQNRRLGKKSSTPPSFLDVKSHTYAKAAAPLVETMKKCP
jgi:hypothetical protein